MHSPDRSAHSTRQVLARVRSLQRHRASRDSSKTFWIEGIRQFLQAAEAGFSFDSIVHSKVLLSSAPARKLLGQLTAAGVHRVGVTPEAFRGVSIMERASGVGAIVKQRWTPIDRASATRGIGWLVLERVRSAGNLGTVLRTAEATGVAGVIFLDPACDPYDPPAVRASMGGIFHLQLVRTSHGRLRRWADAQGMKLLALTPHGQELWSAAAPPQPPSPTALLVGEERRGLSARALAISDEQIRLPMTGRADSLNIGVAAGVMMYELIRRRREAEAATAGPR